MTPEQREKKRAYDRAWSQTPTGQESNRRKSKRHLARKRGGLRAEIFDHYGRFCACCGDTHVEFLTVDHINDDGAAHRRELAAKLYPHRANDPRVISGMSVEIWKQIISDGFPDTFQILCWNCNNAKHRHGTCPHQSEKSQLRLAV